MRESTSPARRWIGLLLATAAAVALYATASTPAFAADPVLEVVQVGWDGQIVPGSWSPVRVRVTGGSSDLNGRVEVVTRIRIQQNPQEPAVEYPTGAYGQEVAIPAGVAKEITLWVPSDPNFGGPTSYAGSVQLVANGHPLAEDRVEFKSSKTPFWPLIGVLADSPAISRAISQVELPVQGLPVPLSAARLSAADLPSSVERLGALSALVVQGNAAASLTGEQRTAIQQWVRAGGDLVLAGGPDAPRTASVLPAGALPVTFSGADGSADLAALGQWAGMKDQPLSPGPAARLKVDGSSVLAGTGDRPMALRAGLGQGTVTLLAVDPGLEPVASWKGTPALFQKALEPALPGTGEMNDKLLYMQMQQQNVPSRLQGAVEALPPDAFPGWQAVALLLGGFVLVVGPLLHFVLARTDRRVWAWGLVPAAALLLTGVMYYVGIGRDGRDVIVNVVSYIRLDPAAERTQQTVLAGFFAPTHSTLSVEVPGEAPVRPGAQGSFNPYYSPYGRPPQGTSMEPPFRVVSGRDTRVEFGSGEWNMRTVSLSRTVSGVGGITARLGLEEGLIKGTLRNDTPYLLEDAGVFVGQTAAKLGSISPGQTVPVTLDPGPPPNPFGGGFPISWRLFGRPRGSGGQGSLAAPARVSAVSTGPGVVTTMAYPGMPEQLEVPNDPEVQRRIRLMDPFVNVPRMGPGSPSMPLTLFAFTRTPVGNELPAAAGHPAYYLTLLEQPLRLELPPGPFTLPAAMSIGEVVLQSGGMGGGSNGSISWIQVQGGSIVYEFRPPLPARSVAEALTITTRQMGQSTSVAPGKGMVPPSPNTAPGPAEAGVFSVYNWQAAAWEQLPAGKEEVRLEPAAPYLGPEGELRLRATAEQDRVVMILQPELTVEGRVTE